MFLENIISSSNSIFLFSWIPADHESSMGKILCFFLYIFAKKRDFYPSFSFKKLFLLLFLYYFIVSVLVCYSCSSKISLEDCENKQTSTPGCKNLKDDSSPTCYIFQSVSSQGHVSIGKNCINDKLCHKQNACHRDAKECKVGFIYDAYK